MDVTGHETGPDTGTYAAYLPSPFRFCLRCRTSYEQARGSDFAKLAKLSAEGRSSAHVADHRSRSSARCARWQGDLDERARKLLAFVDNRQDASPAGRALQRLRPGHPAAGRAVPGADQGGRRPDRRDRRPARSPRNSA